MYFMPCGTCQPRKNGRGAAAVQLAALQPRPGLAATETLAARDGDTQGRLQDVVRIQEIAAMDGDAKNMDERYADLIEARDTLLLAYGDWLQQQPSRRFASDFIGTLEALIKAKHRAWYDIKD